VLLMSMVSLFCTPLQAQSTEELIQAHIRAVGGEEKWDQIKSMQVSETMVMDGTTFKITRRIIRNKALRKDIRIEDRAGIGNDKVYYIIVNENEGWKYLPDNPNFSVLTLIPEEITSYREELDPDDPFIHYREKNREIQLLNIETVGSNEYYKFLIRYPSGRQYFCFVNTQTQMIDRMVLTGADYEEDRLFGEYTRLPEGVMIPKRIETPLTVIQVGTVKINPDLKMDIFQPGDTNKLYYKH
ncbi:MAG TPA: hypothetical protein PLP14_10785, partial [Chitinophagaceae bacterium]|nr:hypothetical protein [Chitinophagaceae bacterium]